MDGIPGRVSLLAPLPFISPFWLALIVSAYGKAAANHFVDSSPFQTPGMEG
jgi:hypothetical protein